MRCRQTYTGRRCPTCAGRRRDLADLRDAANPEPDPYDQPTWRETSRLFLALHPRCECDQHRGQPDAPRAQVVDHIDGLGPLGPRGYDWTNLQALTRRCHSRKTATHDGGFGNPVRRAATPR